MRLLKILGIIMLVIAALIAALLLLLWRNNTKPLYAADYYERFSTTAPLENKYARKGSFTVSAVEFPSEDEKIGGYKVWYPTELSQSDRLWPMVISANGSGCPASRYEPWFERLASWGFIVVGNQDHHTGTGYSPSASLDLMLAENSDPDSLFYEKIDLDSIGIAGHSQGGVGAINAVTSYENGHYYKTLFTACATHQVLADALGWTYDPSKVTIPWFMTAGTGPADAGEGENYGIAPLQSLRENAAALPDGVASVIARTVDADHGDVLERADGYMTAWMLCWLQDDQDAAKVFIGDDAEILTNPLYQDQQKTIK